MVKFTPKFFDNQSYFVGLDGDKSRDFLNAREFRKYLNKYFKAGSTYTVGSGPSTHWVFRKKNGAIFDTIADGIQNPDGDLHCTMYSLYSEIACASVSVKRRFLELSDLNLETIGDNISSELSRYRNLRKLYLMLGRVLTDKPLHEYILKFPIWRDGGDYIKDGKYVDKVRENLREIETAIEKEIALISKPSRKRKR